jgi:hypothetical protein
MRNNEEISRAMSLIGRIGGKKGGRKGGKARWEGLSPEDRQKLASSGGAARARNMTQAQRSEAARKASLAYWGKRGVKSKTDPQTAEGARDRTE